MNFALPVLLAAMLPCSALAATATFYIGTYTKPGHSEGIYVSTLETDTGKLGPVELAGKAGSPSFVALSPNGKNLYAAVEAGGGSVAAFAVGTGGKLAALNDQPAGGDGTCHVWVDGTGKNVLAANYTGGSVVCYRLKSDGSLGERSFFQQYEGAGPDKVRQERPHAHSIYTDFGNQFAYSCDLGTDNVWTFHFDPATGVLRPAEAASAKVPSGAGPRHLAIHPNGRFAFANNEMGLSVTAFTRDEKTGALTPFETLPTLPEGTPTKGVSTAEIFCHPTGKWLYVSNRGHGSIAVYAIGTDGKLTWIETAPATVKVPRGFAIDPSGKWLVVGGQDEDKIAVLKIDAATGKLTPNGASAEVGSPVCILFQR